MKTLILSLAIFAALATPTRAAQVSSTNGVPGGSSGAPAALNNNIPAVFPWQANAGANPARLNRLLADLRGDIETVGPTLAALSDSVDYNSGDQQAAAEDSGVAAVAQYASGNTVLPARDLSTLLSQNLSVNLGQNLSTSLAVPTSVPWSTWGNGPGMVLANVNGTVMAVPTLPPRTAWGNGPGVVVTTPGGAVFSVMPATAPVANPDTMRDVLRQLSNVQDDLDRVLRYLATMNLTNAVAPSAPATSPPTSPPVYLNPTGR